ncbi:solute carrier family 40 member 1 [Elysia marginata]|uniref:Solute carrier family 40 member n=1 Tax=Elysia marginata TaxID=1093978 RepID=A0AAV4F760_9GAST|nr:solute carrier family 40 member 1 [Elysia marginata]
MWSFGVALFLIIISPKSLLLSAVYGLCMGLSTLFFGSLVGDIVDRAPRLKAAQTALVLQNLFVMLCALVIYFFMVYRENVDSYGLWAQNLVYALIIVISVMSRLTSMARKIAVENDWIVQICGSDFDMLAVMTATLRRIDLATQILAPIATGFIMSFIGVEFGALFVGSWNVLSVFAEYYLLWKVYNTVPSLRQLKDLRKSEGGDGATASKQAAEIEMGEAATSHEDNVDPETASILDKRLENSDSAPKENTTEAEVKRENTTCCHKLNFFGGLYSGWPVYVKYTILPAGLSLACLYMTVLGFDSITVGYIKLQGVSEAVLGLCMGISAAVGIVGTLVYPLMRTRFGLIRTGIFGFSAELMSLSLCVASIWLPGSPFDLSLGFGRPQSDSLEVSASNCTNGQTSVISYNTSQPELETQQAITSTTDPVCQKVLASEGPNISIWLFLAGIITARFGLWLADLSVSQIYFETVVESERGKVGGVQAALNQFMDMLKFGLVMILPYEHQFGLLALVSFAFIGLGWLLYAIFLHKSRGHFFHLEKCLVGCGGRPATASESVVQA